MDTVKGMKKTQGLVCRFGVARCSFGTFTAPLMSTDTRVNCTLVNSALNVLDYNKSNIPTPFGMCASITNPFTAAATIANFGALTPTACPGAVVGAPWLGGHPMVKVRNASALLKESKCICLYGCGVISIVFSGQGLSAPPPPVAVIPDTSNYDSNIVRKVSGWLGLAGKYALPVTIMNSLGMFAEGQYAEAVFEIIPVDKALKWGKKGLKFLSNSKIGKVVTDSKAGQFVGEKTKGVRDWFKTGDEIQNPDSFKDAGHKLVAGAPDNFVGNKIRENVEDMSIVDSLNQKLDDTGIMDGTTHNKNNLLSDRDRKALGIKTYDEDEDEKLFKGMSGAEISAEKSRRHEAEREIADNVIVVTDESAATYNGKGEVIDRAGGKTYIKGDENTDVFDEYYMQFVNPTYADRKNVNGAGNQVFDNNVKTYDEDDTHGLFSDPL
ncbi:MAG: DUF4280 domain-containing protein [Prevotella sp.]|nr:DUF4280 domain-containing protein [Prevotella sp.]